MPELVVPGHSDPASDDGVDDRQSFRRLYPKLHRFAAVVASADVDPDDLVQEALTRVLSAGGLVGIEYPEAYLRRSIANLASNGRRRLARRRIAVRRLQAGTPAGVEPVYPSEVDALLALEPMDRAVLYLADVEGWSFEEVGRQLGMRGDTARGRASRARRRLRERLASGEEDHGHA